LKWNAVFVRKSHSSRLLSAPKHSRRPASRHRRRTHRVGVALFTRSSARGLTRRHLKKSLSRSNEPPGDCKTSRAERFEFGLETQRQDDSCHFLRLLDGTEMASFIERAEMGVLQQFLGASALRNTRPILFAVNERYRYFDFRITFTRPAEGAPSGQHLSLGEVKIWVAP
jgi:hypothetical protein